MGTGKTVVGRRVAERLGRAFIDMDALIQARDGRTIKAIFSAEGERYFRGREAQLCRELAESNNLVIATGGGTLVDPSNRAAFEQAFVVCLDATVDALLSRLQGANDRPMLEGENVRERLDVLLSTRRVEYAKIERHVNTTGKTADQVADEVISMFLAGQE